MRGTGRRRGRGGGVGCVKGNRKRDAMKEEEASS